jgi:hypothetical protein
MENRPTRLLITTLSLAALPIFAMAIDRSVMAAEAGGSTAPVVVITKEVWQAIGRAKWERPPSDTSGPYADANLPDLREEHFQEIGSPLTSPYSYPTLTVTVDPPQPADFVVSINGTAYQAGACLFKVVAGPAKIVVYRQDKPPCTVGIDVTDHGPNAVACKL